MIHAAFAQPASLYDSDAANTRRIYWWAFGVRVTIGLAAWLLVATTNNRIIEDAVFYEQLGAGVAADWLAGRESFWLNNAMASGNQPWVLIALIAMIYFLLGGIRALPLLIVLYSLVTAHTPVLTFRIVKELGASSRAARFAANLVIFSPCFAFWAGALYKEGLILLLLNVLVLHTIRLLNSWQWRSVAAIAFTLPLLFGLRYYIAIFAALSAGAAILFDFHGSLSAADRFIRIARNAGAVAAVVLAALWVGMPAKMEMTLAEDAPDVMQRVSRSRTDLARTNSGYLPNADVSTPARAARFAPIGASYFMLVPLPWHIGRMRQNLAIPETTIWILLYPLALIGLSRVAKRNRRAAIFMVTFILIQCVFYGIFVGNIGTAYRLRSQVWLCLAAFAGIGWSYLRAKREAEVGSVRAAPPAVPRQVAV